MVFANLEAQEQAFTGHYLSRIRGMISSYDPDNEVVFMLDLLTWPYLSALIRKRSGDKSFLFPTCTHKRSNLKSQNCRPQKGSTRAVG